MKEALLAFAKDVVEGGIIGASSVLLVTNLDTVSVKVLVAALIGGFLKGVIAAAMRYAATPAK